MLAMSENARADLQAYIKEIAAKVNEDTEQHRLYQD